MTEFNLFLGIRISFLFLLLGTSHLDVDVEMHVYRRHFNFE